jgi:glutaredoxin
MPRPVVTIYSRPGCHLCDQAKAVIEQVGRSHQFTLEEINIADSPALEEQYGYDIPVVFINGVKVFKHKVYAREFEVKLGRLSGLGRR